ACEPLRILEHGARGSDRLLHVPRLPVSAHRGRRSLVCRCPATATNRVRFLGGPVTSHVTMNRTPALADSAFRFVLTMGIVNLFADMTYEGGGSINGAFMG